tara:strand:- start:262 stop:720 length:459 start_codon:yes stop_codon:yes gene_type:complete
MDAGDKIFQSIVPTEEIIEIKNGERKSVQRKVFPGYMLIQMIMNDDTWRVVRETPGVTGFISAEDEQERRPRPVPLEEREVDQILNRMEVGEPKVKVSLTQGQPVKITTGPFAEFMGSVDAIDEIKGKVRVVVSFFGREIPVELDFFQVEKI